MAQEATLVREEGQGGAQDVRYGDDPTAAYEGGGDDDNYYHQYAGYGDGEYEGFYYDYDYEESSDEELGTEAGADLSLDVAHQFIFGGEWRSDITSFLSEHAHVFAPDASARDSPDGPGAQDDFSQPQHKVFCSFRVFAERRLDAVLSSMGLTSDALAARCRRVLRTEGSSRRDVATMVVQSLLAVDSFAAFARLCIDFSARQKQENTASSAASVSSSTTDAPRISVSDRTVVFSRAGPLGLELAPRVSPVEPS